jgi:hypothetical protein
MNSSEYEMKTRETPKQMIIASISVGEGTMIVVFIIPFPIAGRQDG